MAVASEKPRTTIVETLGGAALVSFTLLVGCICVFMLSCTLTQTRLSTIAFSGVNVSVWKLEDIRKQWKALRDQIDNQSTAVATAENEKGRAATESSFFDLSYKPARTKLDSKLNALLLKLNGLEPALAKAMVNQGPVERIETIESQQATLLSRHPELKDGVTDVIALGGAYKEIDARRIKLRSESETRSQIADVASKNLASLQSALDNLFSTQFGVKPIDAATRARIENALFELYGGGPLGEATHYVLVLSPEILTLCLVVLMGILGSSLQLTHQTFIRGDSNGLGINALRLCVGAITALVIFIVAKAGVPVLADTSRLGGDTPINPYFVSFLAIISGLMSEQAIDSVQSQAVRYFGSGKADQPRWARRTLRDAVEISKRNPIDLAKTLGVSPNVFDEWLDAKAPVPQSAQQLLAAVLDIPLRELFSDLAPDEAETASPSSQRNAPMKKGGADEKLAH